MSYNIILFDVDGTLCDPGPSLIESAKFALSQMGIQENDENNLRRFVGPPLEHSFEDYYGFDKEKTKQAVAYFREKMQSDGIKLYKTYEGIPELLESLKQTGKTLAVVTSKIDHIAETVLKNAGLFHYFEVIGAQQANIVVRKELILQEVLSKLNASDRSSIIMVGDRKYDIEAANVQGIDSVGVLWGYGTVDEFHSEGATHTASDANELKNLLTQ